MLVFMVYGDSIGVMVFILYTVCVIALTLMQLGRYTLRQNRVAPSPMQDALWLHLTVDLAKMHQLAQIICPSKGQSSTAILRYRKHRRIDSSVG